MSPLPARMADHWWQRPGRFPGRLQYHWHLLFHDQPAVRELADLARRQFAELPNLDVVAPEWLHLTTLVVGFADEVSADQVTVMTAQASRGLVHVAPITVTLGRGLLPPRGGGAPGRADRRAAASPGRAHRSRARRRMRCPHRRRRAGHPAASAEITIRSASLVAQAQVGRTWQWQPTAEVHLAR
jgi:hypothetical protein